MSDLYHNSLWLIPGSVIIAGLVGSPHCLSMCGPIVANFAENKKRLFTYQIGRLISYTLAGTIFGGFGHVVLGSTNTKWMNLLALISIGVLLILNGYRVFKGATQHIRLPKAFTKLFIKIWQLARYNSLPQPLNSFLAGLFTIFLPCGHLYSFLIASIATGTALKGAIFMSAFWLSSTPLLSMSGILIQKIFNTKKFRHHKLAGALLILAGIFSLYSFGSRVEAFSRNINNSHAAPHCHSQ